MTPQERVAAISQLQDWQLSCKKIDYQGHIGEITGMDYVNGEVHFYILQQVHLPFDEAIVQLRDRIIVVAEQAERLETGE